MFQCGRCFNAHIEKKKSKCDYHFPRPLTADEIEEIQSRVNRIARSDMPINEKFISRTEALNKFNADKLPADVGDRIRVVSIGDYDHCFEGGVLRIRYKLKAG
jgi:alanyl-tRNA synthetase